ncbi:PfkB family carbohydrate kinase [Micromonospora sp. CPCC 205546]|uniref:PfkB family carbohydrate kinase n=1 Tax=Micromonospora sp. CPCC 205546 TaxID=3122397 RepID=UPI002FEE99E5
MTAPVGPGSPAPGVVVVSDALVDIIEYEDGTRTRHPGGAGLNLAVGVRRLGTAAVLAAPVSADHLGGWLRNAIADAGVTLVPLACSLPTGTAISRRVAGEPVYEFSAAIHERRYSYTPGDVAAIAAGSIVVVNSFPMHDPDQVAALVEVVRRAGRTFVVDPNVRPSLVRDVPAYRSGFRQLADVADVVKLSLQDIAGLDVGDPSEFVADLLRSGVRAVVLTRAADGVSVHTADGVVATAPVPVRPGPIVDTMGAGDATLARLVCGFAEYGIDLDTSQWSDLAREAMDLAADVCRISGGNLAALRLTEREER